MRSYNTMDIYYFCCTITVVPDRIFYNGDLANLSQWHKMCTHSSTAGSTPGEVARAVETSLRAGYRNFDFAKFYFNEPEIGEALQKCFKEGVVKREEVFITSKLW